MAIIMSISNIRLRTREGIGKECTALHCGLDFKWTVLDPTPRDSDYMHSTNCYFET